MWRLAASGLSDSGEGPWDLLLLPLGSVASPCVTDPRGVGSGMKTRAVCTDGLVSRVLAGRSVWQCLDSLEL